MPKRMTQQQFENRLYKISPDIKVLGKYKGTHYHIKIKHKKCGYIWLAKAGHLLEGNSCPKCANKLHSLQMKYRQAKLHKDLPTPIIIQKPKNPNPQTHVTVICPKCKYKYKVTLDDLKRGHKCPRCTKRLPLTQKEVQKRIHKIHPNLLLIGKYKTKRQRVLVKCTIHNCIYDPIGEELLKGENCPLCAREQSNAKKRFTKKQFCQKLNKNNSNVKLIGNYNGTNNLNTVKCLLCGKTWSALGSALLDGKNCPYCQPFESIGEQLIKTYLKLHHYKYAEQFVFETCKNILPLPFDFAVFNKNNSLNCLIEFQGQQHFMAIKKFDGQKAFKSQQKRDQIKQAYCKNHHIKLIYINNSKQGSHTNYIRKLVTKTLKVQLHVH